MSAVAKDYCLNIDNVAPAGTAKKAPHRGAFFVVRTILVFICAALSLTACAADSEKVFVKTVIDGDTVRLENGETIRLLGINAPEKDFKDRPAQPLSLEATLLLKELVEGRTVHLTKGREDKDQYHRTLGYLSLIDGTDVQRALIDRGYAFVVAFPPNIDRLDEYISAEKSAKKKKKGVWALTEYQPTDVSKHSKLQGGFGLVTGKVTKVRSSKKNVRLHLGSRMVVGIRHAAWERFWNQDANSLRGKSIVARGWIQASNKKNPAYLRVRHPAMMEIK